MAYDPNHIPNDMFTEVKALLGLPTDKINSAAATAIQSAWDMGYRSPASLANMADKLLNHPQET